MALKIKKSWSDLLVLGLAIFLIFCLIFESYIKVPELVGWLGNWHPLMLHFPIVLLMIAVFVSLVHKKISHALLTLATLTALLTAITGFLLSLGSTSKGNILMWHQWLGSGVALLTTLWYWLDSQNLGQHKITKALQIALVITTVSAGHFGGMITHGEDFLALPNSNSFKKIPKNPLIYKHVVAQIIDKNCASCHNPNKQKGEYSMSSLKELLKGGKTGKAIDIDHPEKSELLMRLYLPKADEKHMPPEEKKQLTGIEIQLIEAWIRLGASDTLQLHHLKNDEPLVALVNTLMQPDAKVTWDKLPKIEKSTLVQLSSDYITIKRLSSATDALSINAYLPPQYSSEIITMLAPIAKNIVEFDLSGIPITEKEMEFIGTCVNLEKLEIDQTPVSDADIIHLKGLSKLRLLRIYETNISDKSIPIFNNLKSLEKVYIWKTSITRNGLEQLNKSKPSLFIDDGIEAEIESFFTLADTIPKS